MHLKKAKLIDEWPELKNLKQLQQFTGFCNWYCQFIKDYSKIAKPLTQLTGNVPFTWGNEQREAMEELKRQLSSQPVLAIPNEHDLFRVEADSSNYALGAVLSQKQNGI